MIPTLSYLSMVSNEIHHEPLFFCHDCNIQNPLDIQLHINNSVKTGFQTGMYWSGQRLGVVRQPTFHPSSIYPDSTPSPETAPARLSPPAAAAPPARADPQQKHPGSLRPARWLRSCDRGGPSLHQLSAKPHWQVFKASHQL